MRKKCSGVLIATGVAGILGTAGACDLEGLSIPRILLQTILFAGLCMLGVLLARHHKTAACRPEVVSVQQVESIPISDYLRGIG